MLSTSESGKIKQRLDELLLFAASRNDSLQIGREGLALLLGISTESCSDLIRRFHDSQKYTVIESGSEIFLMSVSFEAQLEIPAWVLDAVLNLIGSATEARAPKPRTKALADIWCLAPQEFAGLIGDERQRKAVATILDYQGYHRYAFDLGVDSLWALTRLAKTED